MVSEINFLKLKPMGNLLFISLLSFSSFCKVNKPQLQFATEILPRDSLFIVKNGISLIPILLPEKNTPRIKEAAMDLANYIQKISGAKPIIKIIDGFDSSSKGIWVGNHPQLSKIFPTIDFTYTFPEEIIIAANERNIIIAGRDKWTTNGLNVKAKNGKPLNNIQMEYGTCNAVYTFIQNTLDVRWLWPGALGEDYSLKKNIAIKPFEYRYHPTILDRTGTLRRTQLLMNKRNTEEADWMKFQRNLLSSLEINGHYGFYSWWNRFNKTNPEYFALLPNGTRKLIDKPTNVKICQSNPKVWKEWINDVKQQLENNPNQTTFSASANDSWSRGHCTCANCRAWDAPGFSWSKPNLSDRSITFANKLDSLLQLAYPNMNYQVVIQAYGFTRPAPLVTKPSKNLIIENVANFFMRGEGTDESRSLAMREYADWGKIAKYNSFRPNLGNPAGLSAGLPDIAPHQAAEDFKFIAKNNCNGLYFDTYWHHWANQGIQYYTIAQLAWNTNINIDSLLNDYYLRAYGKASLEMKQYWELMEYTRNDFLSKEKNRFRFFNIHNHYNDVWATKAEMLISKAKAKYTDRSSKYYKRIELAQSGLNYAKMVIDIRKNMTIWEKDNNNIKAYNNIIYSWERIDQLKKSMPSYAINFETVFSRTGHASMHGLHPKNQVNKQTKKILMRSFE